MIQHSKGEHATLELEALRESPRASHKTAPKSDSPQKGEIRVSLSASVDRETTSSYSVSAVKSEESSSE